MLAIAVIFVLLVLLLWFIFRNNVQTETPHEKSTFIIEEASPDSILYSLEGCVACGVQMQFLKPNQKIVKFSSIGTAEYINLNLEDRLSMLTFKEIPGFPYWVNTKTNERYLGIKR